MKKQIFVHCFPALVFREAGQGLLLVLSFHADSLSGTDKGTDAAALAVIQVDLNTAGCIFGDAQFGAYQAAQIAAVAGMVAQAPPGLLHCLLFTKYGFIVRFDAVCGFKPAFPGNYRIFFSHGNTFVFPIPGRIDIRQLLWRPFCRRPWLLRW